MLLTRDPIQGKRHTQIESEGMEKDISCKQKQQKSGCSNIDRIDFKTKPKKKDKEGHYKWMNTRRGYYTR